MLMERILLIIIIIIVVWALYDYWMASDPKLTRFGMPYKSESGEYIFTSQFRDLWISFVSNIREYIIRTVNHLPAQQDTEELVMSDSMKIVASIDSLYPNKNSLEFLFRKHVNIFVKVVTAIITHDGENYDEFMYAWKNNVAFIAEEMNKINPDYSYDLGRKLFAEYQTAIDNEVRACLNQKPALYQSDAVMKAAINLADYFALNYQKN